jgi:hypothetical protein
MENLSSLTKSVNLTSVSGMETEEGSTEGKTRIGPRVRAFAEFMTLLDEAKAKGWDLNTVRSALETLRDGAPKGSGGPSATGRQSFCVGVSRRGNRILLQIAQSDEKDLQEEFAELYRFNNKKDALNFISSGDPSQGTMIFSA